MPFQITEFKLSSNEITPPATINLSYTLNANNGTSVKVLCLLAEENNVYFKKEDGTSTKEIPREGTVHGTTITFTHDVKIIVKAVPEGQESKYFYIKLKATDLSNNNGDHKTAKISII